MQTPPHVASAPFGSVAVSGLPAGVVVLRRAEAEFQADGGARSQATVSLPHRWDRAYPRDGGRARYRLMLPPPERAEPYGLFFVRVGNQSEIRVGGQLAARTGVLGDASSDSAKAPLWVGIAAGQLSADGPTPLEVEVTAQSGRWGGLSLVYYGPESVLRPMYEDNHAQRHTATVVIVISLGLLGLIAAGLWWRQREPLYGLFALSALFGVIRMGDRVLPEPPLPWPWWGAVTSAAFVAHMLLMAAFSLRTLNLRTPWVERALYAWLGVSVLCAAVAFVARWPSLWTFTLGSMAVPGVLSLVLVVRCALTTRAREAWLLTAAGAVVVAAGLRDFVLVRLGAGGGGETTFHSLQPHAVLVFALFMSWIIVERYSLQVRRFRELAATLEQRIREREAELGRTHEQLQRQGQEQAALRERQRIMRDIHDGVGAQLVGLLSQLKRGDVQRETLQEQVGAALDELRMAVDSLQPVHGDLATVLATLRYRLQPRLQAAGLEMLWDVDELPPLPGLTPQVVLQLQRVLLEAFTNILRHAQATRVEVHAHHRSDPPRLELQVRDNGQGFDTAQALHQAHGHGLGNMRARCDALGARLAVESAPARGTVIRLELPVQVGQEA